MKGGAQIVPVKLSALWSLFTSFFRIGAFTFGGGYAMLPMIEKEIVDRRQWCTEEEIMDYFAVSQCTPGVIAVNSATFIGYKVGGVLGAVIATLGVICPSIAIILGIAAVLQNFARLEVVQHAFAGIRVAVAALIAGAIVKLWKSGVKDGFGLGIFCVTLVVMLFLNPSPVFVVVLSALAGILWQRMKGGRKE